MGAIGTVGFKVIGMAFAIPSGIVANKLLHKAWESSRGHKPPGSKDSKSPESNWPEVIVWAGLSAAVTAAVQAAATRGASATYRALTGQQPPVKKKKKEAAAA